MVFVQEMCLVPSNIVNELLNSDINVNANIKKTQSNDVLKDKKNLYPVIKNTFKSKNKINKANDLYSWILKNYPDFEVSNSGDVIQPIKNINFLEFMQDIFSNSIKTISNEKLNLYKIFTSIIDIPSMYIDNKSIKNYLYPNLLTFQKPSIKKRKKEEKIINELENLSDNDTDYDLPMTPIPKFQKKNISTKELENFIETEYKAATPIRKSSLRLRRQKKGTGGLIKRKFNTGKKKIWLSF